MLLRNSIAKTKRFFHKTIESFKSLLSGGYERIPKTPPFNPCSCAGGSDNNPYCGDFSTRWDSSHPKKAKKMSHTQTQQPIAHEEIYGGSFLKFGKQSPAKTRHEEKRRRKSGKELRTADSPNSHGGGDGDSPADIESNVRERGSQLVVVQKLKELEMMDASDVEHVLDIEEVIHYYSRLTCPAYLDIVNKFFMEMCSDLSLPQPTSSSSSSVNNNYSRRNRF